MRFLLATLIMTLAACSRHTERVGEWLPNETLTVVSERTGDTLFTYTDIPEAIVAVDANGQRRTIYVRLTTDAFDRYASLPEEELLAVRLGSETVVRFPKFMQIGSHPPEFALPDTIRSDGKHLSETLFTVHRFAQRP